jgi:hypothetical protein
VSTILCKRQPNFLKNLTVQILSFSKVAHTSVKILNVNFPAPRTTVPLILKIKKNVNFGALFLCTWGGPLHKKIQYQILLHLEPPSAPALPETYPCWAVTGRRSFLFFKGQLQHKQTFRIIISLKSRGRGRIHPAQ